MQIYAGQRFGIIKICALKLHLFDQEYSRNSNIVKFL